MRVSISNHASVCACVFVGGIIRGGGGGGGGSDINKKNSKRKNLIMFQNNRMIFVNVERGIKELQEDEVWVDGIFMV